MGEAGWILTIWLLLSGHKGGRGHGVGSGSTVIQLYNLKIMQVKDSSYNPYLAGSINRTNLSFRDVKAKKTNFCLKNSFFKLNIRRSRFWIPIFCKRHWFWISNKSFNLRKIIPKNLCSRNRRNSIRVSMFIRNNFFFFFWNSASCISRSTFSCISRSTLSLKCLRLLIKCLLIWKLKLKVLLVSYIYIYLYISCHN